MNDKIMPNWNTFDEMKAYAKEVSKDVIEMGFSDYEIFTNCFGSFEDLPVVNDCYELAKAFVSYKKDGSLLQVTKDLTRKLSHVWDERAKDKTKDVQEQKVDENEIVRSDYEEIEDIPEQQSIFGSDTLMDSGIHDDEMEATDNDISSLEKASNDKDEEKKLKRQISTLKKKMVEINIEYDETKTLEENKSLYESAKRKAEEIDKLKTKLSELDLEFNEDKSFEENQDMYEVALDKKENPSYKYPFKIYFKGHDIRQLDDIFEENQEYTVKELVNLMFKHGYKEYAGKVNLEYDTDENMFVPDFLSQRHG